MTIRGYTVGIDWSRAGTYAGTLEDVSSYVLDSPDLEVSYGRDSTQAAADASAGKLTFALRNDDRQFSPENSASPIAGKVQPGCRVKFDKLLGGALYTLFSGDLDDLEVDPHAAAKDFSATVLDAWGRPGAEKLSTPLYSGLRTGDAIGLILDAIGWTGGRDLDPGATLMPWWWEEGTDAVTAVQKLVDSEGPPAIAYVQGGTFTFRDRHHRLTRTASTTSNGTFTHIIPEGSGPAGDFKVLADTFTYNHGLQHIVNSVSFSVDQRVAGDLEQVWSTDSPITLAAGEVLIIEAKTSDPFLNAVVPTSDDYDLAFGSVTVTLSRTSGQSTLITLTAGGVAAQLNRLALRAVRVSVARTFKVSEEDISSINAYREQTWPNDLPWAGVYDARAIAQRIVSTYATNRPVVTFEVEALNDTYLTQILARKISDRITVRNDAIGVNRDFHVERIVHTVKQLGVRHTVQFTCEVTDPVQPATALTFDVAGKGFNQGAFGINGIDNAATMFRFDVPGQGFDQGRFAT